MIQVLIIAITSVTPPQPSEFLGSHRIRIVRGTALVFFLSFSVEWVLPSLVEISFFLDLLLYLRLTDGKVTHASHRWPKSQSPNSLESKVGPQRQTLETSPQRQACGDRPARIVLRGQALARMRMSVLSSDGRKSILGSDQLWISIRKSVAEGSQNRSCDVWVRISTIAEMKGVLLKIWMFLEMEYIMIDRQTVWHWHQSMTK